MNPEVYIFDLEEPYKRIVSQVHQLLLTFPNIRCKIRYGIPFYDYRIWLCYLNLRKDGSVDLTFLQGKKLDDPAGMLEDRGRKMVSTLVIRDLSDETMEKVVTMMAIAMEHQDVEGKSR